MSNKVPYLEIEDAKLIFRNFSGAETQFNRKGNRNFHVVLEDEETIQKLINDGWNVRIHDKNENYDPITTLNVCLRFDILPPDIYMMTSSSSKPTKLDEESVSLLDYADIVNVDLVIRPRFWEVNGKSGIKAYLKTMYVTIQEDKFAHKYLGEDYDD